MQNLLPFDKYFIMHTSTSFRRVLIDCVGFNDTSAFVGHFVLSPREREKRDRRDSSGDEREGQGREENE